MRDDDAADEYEGKMRAQDRLTEATGPGAPFAGWRGFTSGRWVCLEPPGGTISASDLVAARDYASRDYGYEPQACFRTLPHPGIYLAFRASSERRVPRGLGSAEGPR